MSKKVKMVLVQGEATFKVDCNLLTGLVSSGQASNSEYLKSWLEDKAIELIDCADVEVEIINEVPVEISEDTARKYNDDTFGRDVWKEIISESKE